jgi:hypothetical protein
MSRPDASKNVKAYKGLGHNIEIVVVRSGQTEKTVLIQFRNIDHPWNNKIVPHERVMVSPERVEYKTQIQGDEWLTMLGQKMAGSWQYTVKLQGIAQEIAVAYADKLGKEVEPQEIAAAYTAQLEQERNAPVTPQPEASNKTESKGMQVKPETQVLDLPETPVSSAAVATVPAKAAKSAPATAEDKSAELLLRVIEGIEANQDFTANEDKSFKNYFDFKLMLGNRGTMANALVDVKVSFFVDGKWVTGIIVSGNGLPVPQNVATGCAVVFRVTTAIQVKGVPGTNNQERATSHSSLSDPLKIRLEFEMLRGDNIAREFEYRRK